MKQVILLHNPNAGDEDHLKEELVNAIEKEGYSCTYFSIKKDAWKQQIDNADFAVVAGGDGTVRTVVKELVKRNILDKKIPVTLLPMGTANNLSKTLGFASDANDKEAYIRKWKQAKRQKFDVGVVKNTDVTDFFLESVGFGVFPKLMKQMVRQDKSGLQTKKDEIKLALKVLYDIICSYPAEHYRIETEKGVLEKDCLLLEVMNIKSVGPNLFLAKDAKTDDCMLDVVYVEEYEREKFAEGILSLINDDKESTFNPQIIKAERVEIISNSRYMHVDDELIIPMKNPVFLESRENVLEFLV